MQAVDEEAKRWLMAALADDMLEVKRITFDTSSGNTLELVAKGEAVHKVRR